MKNTVENKYEGFHGRMIIVLNPLAMQLLERN